MKSAAENASIADTRNRVEARAQKDNKTLYETSCSMISETWEEIEELNRKSDLSPTEIKQLAYKRRWLQKLEKYAYVEQKAESAARKRAAKIASTNPVSEPLVYDVEREKIANTQEVITEEISDAADPTSLKTGSAAPEISSSMQEGRITVPSRMTDAEFEVIWEGFRGDIHLIEGCTDFRVLSEDKLSEAEPECEELATKALYAFQDIIMELEESAIDVKALDSLLDTATRLLARKEG